MFHLVEIVESTITEALPARGAIMSDGWTRKGSTHYVALFGSFNRVVKIMDKGNSTEAEIVEIVEIDLLALSTLEDVGDLIEETGEEASKATSFTAAVHINFFENTMSYYNKNLCEWAVAHTADICNVNKKIGVDTGIPHVGCWYVCLWFNVVF